MYISRQEEARRRGSASLSVSEEPKDTVNPSPAPPDFEDFWARSLSQLLEIDPAVDLTGETYAAGKVELATMESFGGAKVHFLTSERNQEVRASRRPLLVTAHGYGGEMEPERVRRLSQFGFNVVGLDVRGFARSRDAVPRVSPYGYLLTGCESKETSILRGAVLDYIQVYRAGLALFGPPSVVTFQGFSFAGGLSLMAAAVLCLGGALPGAPTPPQLLASGVPTFGYLEKRLELCQAGSGRELYRYLQQRVDARQATLSVFEYFDTCHFAPYLRYSESGLRRIICGAGIFDPIVPAETVFAIVNAMSVTPEVHVMPCSHTDRPEEVEWVKWEGAWIRATRKLGGSSSVRSRQKP